MQNVDSLLLSVKNLENFNKSLRVAPNNYNNENQKFGSARWVGGNNYDQKKQMLANIREILAIDDINLTKANEKGKDVDEVSNVSSKTNTNFTGSYNSPYNCG